MSIMDSFISRLRKIDKNKHFNVFDTIKSYKWQEFASNTIEKGEILIIIDIHGLYKDDINSMGGLYVEVQSVGVAQISVDYPNKSEADNINMEDFQVIGIGFKDNFAENSTEKQSLALGLSLTDFFLEDSKTVNISKYLLISNDKVLEHWGLKTNLDIMNDRSFRLILLED